MQSSIGSPELCQVISDRILQAPEQRLPFAEFMALALYHPQYGYYTTRHSQLGFGGDFVTAAHMGKDFGELLGEQLGEMWGHLGCPDPFHLVEMGPGQGLLAETILAYLQKAKADCFAAIQYTLIEVSPALRSLQQQRLQPWSDLGIPLTWCTLEDLSPSSLTGCFFSNELVDAFPVHRVMLTETGLQELYVAVSEPSDNLNQRFQATIGPLSDLALAKYFTSQGLELTTPPYAVGFTTEVNLAALDWIATVAKVIRRGYVITIDYGYTADRYYSPGRSQGTLQCYYQQAHHNNPFINVGQQDMTAHVDFTALEQEGEQYGLTSLGQMPQELFLMALGLGDRLSALSTLQGTDSKTINYAIQRREQLHQLISPLGMGKFTVLVQSKGLTEPFQRQLKGLTIPPMTV